MKVTFGVSAAEVVRLRWNELVARENPWGGAIGGLVTAVTFAPVLAIVAKFSLLAWAVALPVGAAGIGIGVRRGGRAVTSRYGFGAGIAAVVCGVASLALSGCVGTVPANDFLKLPLSCLAGFPNDFPMIAAALAVAVLLAYFAGFRQVALNELLP